MSRTRADRRPLVGRPAAVQSGPVGPVEPAINRTTHDLALLLPIPEVAAALGVGRTKVYELISLGELEAVHIGRCCRVPTDALRTFVERLRSA